MWRKIDMHNLGDLGNYDLEIMCRHAVDCSQGGLAEIDIWYFGTDHLLLNYIADSSSNLRSLKLVMCNAITVEGFVTAVVKLPLLEVSYCLYSEESLRVVGQCCPNLKTLNLNRVGCKCPRKENDGDALAIAETMPGLRNLQLFGNGLTGIGLNAILDNCLNLEYLDLRQCFYVILGGDLRKRSERIKFLRRSLDSTHDYPYDATVVCMGSSVDDYPYGFFDLNPVSGDDIDLMISLLDDGP